MLANSVRGVDGALACVCNRQRREHAQYICGEGKLTVGRRERAVLSCTDMVGTCTWKKNYTIRKTVISRKQTVTKLST